MFRHEKVDFGKYEKHVIMDNQNIGFEIIPEVGANVCQIYFDGHPILDGITKPEELNVNRWFKSSVLIPFPNRLNQGKYKWLGNPYIFPINDAYTGNALHGYGANTPFEVSEIELHEDSAHIVCKYEDNGQNNAYPFPFTFEARFEITSDARFEVNFKCYNDGKLDIPFGMGWHPYYQLNKSVEEVILQLPECKFIGLDESMLPTGKQYTYDEFLEGKKIGVTVLDNCFAVEPEDNRFEFSIIGKSARLSFWQETGAGKYSYLQLFTPPSRDSIAIEPMTCNIDAFNNRQGLVSLSPKQKIEAKFGLRYDKL